MESEKVQEKIRELLINTQYEEEIKDSVIEDCKNKIMSLSKKIARSAEKEDWLSVDILSRKVEVYTNKAIGRELDIRKGIV